MRLSTLLIVSILLACTPEKQSTDATSAEVPVENASAEVPYVPVADKPEMAQYYEMDHIREWYPERILPPAFDFNIDLSGKSVVELWLLRNEVFARNGYLFDDAVLRGHFNQFKWYQPIFDVPEFKVQLDAQEQQFVDNILAREKELLAGRYNQQGKFKMVSMDHVYNIGQFKQVDDALLTALGKNNFAVVPASHEQLFHVYDNNHYEYIPNFITTDIYLQVLHKHFSKILQGVEEEKFIPLLSGLLADLHNDAVQVANTATDDTMLRAARFASTYLGVANSLITDQVVSDDPELIQEFEKIKAAEAKGSAFLQAPFLQYSQFKPRGNYTKTEELEKYFRCVKWLNMAPIKTGSDERLMSAILIAALIKNSPDNLEAFERFNKALRFIVGEEDNASIANLIRILTPNEASNPASLNNAAQLKRIREALDRAAVDRIKPKGGTEVAADLLAQQSVLFTAGRYTFDAEILSRLIHVLRPDPKRPFPKGLDVFASLGNATATNILLNEYNEAQRWPAYKDTLSVLRTRFSKFNEWDKTIYSKTFETIASLQKTNDKYPLFMKTPAWAKKDLSTSLAAWTELKHDMLLYAEQAYAAQAGEGGGPPPPTHISYVEPNIAFWEKALELLAFQETKLASMDLLTEKTQRIINELKEIGDLLLTVSKKELANEAITGEEFSTLSYFGGRIEYLTFRIFDSDHLPEKERLVAVVADVYNYNGEYLEEAVGMVDEIYVVAEINGKPYLTKGAVFSYYEFTSDTPLSDEEWREQLTSASTIARPEWIREIMVETEGLRSKAGYSF